MTTTRILVPIIYEHTLCDCRNEQGRIEECPQRTGEDGDRCAAFDNRNLLCVGDQASSNWLRWRRHEDCLNATGT